MPPRQRQVARVSVRVMPDTSRFKADLTKSLDRLERTLAVNIPTKLNTRTITQDAVAAKREIERRLSGITTSINLTPDGADIRQTNRMLDAIARDRAARIRPEVDRSALERARRALGGLTSVGGRGLGGVVAVGGLAAVAGGAAAAAGQVAALAAALAPAAGALAALPALAAGAGAALGTLRVATLGVGEAMEAALTGDAEELAEALEGLAPAAQSVVREVAQLRPELEGLRESVQGAFFAPLVGDVERLGAELLPVLSDGMTRVAESMGSAASRVTDFATSSQALTFLDDLFQATADGITAADDALPNFLSGLTAIGTEGLPYLVDLGEAVDSVAGRFNAWATEAAEAGRVTEWIDNSIALFGQLGDILGNLGGIIGSVFGAADGGGLLTTLEQLTGALDDFLSSAEGQEALAGLFEGLGSIGAALAPVITAVASGIGALAPAVGRIAEAIGPVLTRAVEGLVPALQALEPGITAVIGALGDGIDALVSSGALEQLGTALSEILTALSPLLPVLGELAATVLTMLADLLIAIAPSLELLATSLADALAPVLPDLAEAFGELVEAIAPLIPALVEALLPILPLLPDLLAMWVEQGRFLAQVLEDIQPFLLWLIDAAGWLINVVADVISWVLQLVTTLASWGTNAEETATRFWEKIYEMRQKVIDYLTGLRDRAIEKITEFKDGIVDAVTESKDRAVGLARDLKDGITARIDGALAAVRGLPGKIRGFFSGAKDWLLSAGRNVIQGLIDGIQDKVQALRNKMSGVADEVRGYWPFSPAKQGPLRRYPMDQAGRNLAQMLADGIGEGERIVAQASARLAGAAVVDPVAATAGIQAPDSGGDAEGRSVVQVTNYYPQAEPTSVTTNRALQYAAAIGTV